MIWLAGWILSGCIGIHLLEKMDQHRGVEYIAPWVCWFVWFGPVAFLIAIWYAFMMALGKIK